MRNDFASYAVISAPPRPEPLTQRPTDASSPADGAAETTCIGRVDAKAVDVTSSAAKIAVVLIFLMGENYPCVMNSNRIMNKDQIKDE
jgi:hypothetical protein